MTMHMVHAGLNTTNDRPRKKKPTPQQQKAKAEHEAWLRTQGLHPDQLAAKPQPKSKKLSSWKGPVAPGVPCSNTVVDGGAVRSVFEGHWRDQYKDDPLMAEREKIALAKAEELKKNLMPIYNKGPVQVVTPGLSPKDFGKRRP
jgi:hypothetical protein